MDILSKVLGGQRLAKGKSSSDIRLMRADAQIELEKVREERQPVALAKTEGDAAAGVKLSKLDQREAELVAVIRDFDSAMLAAEARERSEATKDQRDAEARRVARDRELRAQLYGEAQEAERC